MGSAGSCSQNSKSIRARGRNLCMLAESPMNAFAADFERVHILLPKSEKDKCCDGSRKFIRGRR